MAGCQANSPDTRGNVNEQNGEGLFKGDGLVNVGGPAQSQT